jgi:putative ABC transport system permease protein
MVRNYLKIALRNLVKNKVHSFINIGGLAVGMASCMLILLYVFDEASYDKHHADTDQLYRIASEVKSEKWVGTGAVYAPALKKDFAEVEQVARLLRFPGIDKMLVAHGQSQMKIFETNTYFVDSTFFQLFNYTAKFGDLKTAPYTPNSIVISEKLATKFFNSQNPLNQTLKVVLSFGEQLYTIKGVFKAEANKSHITANMFLSMNNGHINGFMASQNSWTGNNIFHTYFKLKKGINKHLFESKLTPWLYGYGGKDFKAQGFDKKLFIQPVKDIYLHSNFGFEVATNGNIKNLYLFTSVAIFILLIACINFMNLATARSEKRAKEVGLRKTIGAERKSLVFQFLSESLLMTFVALFLTIAIIQLTTPIFNQLFNKNLSLFHSPNSILWLIVVVLITGLISGMYPAFYLSSFKPISVLKGFSFHSNSAPFIRKSLVVFQFSISIILILSAILINKQMSYMGNKNLGFSKSQKLIIPVQNNESAEKLKTLKAELSKQVQITNLGIGGSYPGIESVNSNLFYAEGKSATENVDIKTIYTEGGYLKTLRMSLLQGRDFNVVASTDHGSILLNETAVKKLGYKVEEALGKKVNFDFNNTTNSLQIIGVIKDYNFESLHQDIKPLAHLVNPFFSGPNRYLIAEISSNDYTKVIASVNTIWNKINPNSPFEYSFLDADFQRNYKTEEQSSKLIQLFTFLAIFISSLGLFGLASFVAEQRTKEIGIRKVLGASVTNLWQLLSKDFVILVIISCLIAAPIAYYFMNEWLQKYTYRTEISWWIFIVAGVGALLITLLTVSYQAIKAALMNPVKSLKTE